jgi:hypothetical protein
MVGQRRLGTNIILVLDLNDVSHDFGKDLSMIKSEELSL